MSKEYSLGSDGMTIVGANTLAFLNPTLAPAPNIDIMRIWTSQQGSSVSAQQRVEVESQFSAYPTLTSATPRQLKMGDQVASLLAGATTGSAGTAGVNASAEGAGGKTVRWGDNFNMLNGYLWVATPREVLSLAAGMSASLGGVGVYLPAAPGSLSNWAVGMNYSEGTP